MNKRINRIISFAAACTLVAFSLCHASDTDRAEYGGGWKQVGILEIMNWSTRAPRWCGKTCLAVPNEGEGTGGILLVDVATGKRTNAAYGLLVAFDHFCRL